MNLDINAFLNRSTVEVIPELAALSPGQLKAVLDLEAAQQGRKTVIAAIHKLLEAQGERARPAPAPELDPAPQKAGLLYNTASGAKVFEEPPSGVTVTELLRQRAAQIRGTNNAPIIVQGDKTFEVVFNVERIRVFGADPKVLIEARSIADLR